MKHWSNLSGLLIVLIIGIWMIFPSCKHEPLLEEDIINPIDTTSNVIDTTQIDTTTNGIPCDPGIVYFDQDVLPILQSNCAFSGCHDVASAQDGVILESYDDVMQTGKVEAYDPGDSEIYEVLVEDDLDKRMPPDPASALSSDQIAIIADWISQGALHLECDPNANGCDTDNVSFAQFVKPLLETHCQGCHSGNNPSGGIKVSTYLDVTPIANSGQLYGAIAHENGFSAMPQGAARLDDCTVDKVKSWIDAGAPNN